MSNLKRQRWTGKPYGAATSSQPSTGTAVLNLVSSWTDYFRNPYRQLAQLQADLQKAVVTGRPQWEIDSLKGQIEAVKYEISSQAETASEISAYSQLGKAATGAGIAVLVASAILILSKAAD